jgi:hypothetical protein
VITLDREQRIEFSEQNYIDAEHHGSLRHETFERVGS